MGSQTDLDQGGTFRPKQKLWMGPSIGWLDAPQAIVRITTGGTITLAIGAAIVTVNFNGAVTIQLPQFKGNVSGGAGAVPGPYVPQTITIIDVGGFAGANPITINAGGSEFISGLASIQITSNNGGVVLQPDPVNGGCTELV
jgi:hypothetical protein